MNIEYLTQIVTNRFTYKKIITGNSNAIALHREKDNVTVLFCSISGGSLQLQYTLDSTTEVRDDLAIWHVSTLDSVDNDSGIIIQSPAAFLRVVASDTVTYTFEIQS